jgi:hypothetical protein
VSSRRIRATCWADVQDSEKMIRLRVCFCYWVYQRVGEILVELFEASGLAIFKMSCRLEEIRAIVRFLLDWVKTLAVIGLLPKELLMRLSLVKLLAFSSSLVAFISLPYSLQLILKKQCKSILILYFSVPICQSFNIEIVR